MASILDLYAGAASELGVDKIKKGASFQGKFGGFYSGDSTIYSNDEGGDADLKVLTPTKLKIGYNMGDLGAGSKYAGGFTGDTGKNYSAIVTGRKNK